MVLPSENAPTSLAAADRQRQSRMEPGTRSGPNKEGASRPDGASVLGTEFGAEADARRERAQAIAEGDKLPPNPAGVDGRTSNAGNLGFGQLTGAEKGFSDLPSDGQRQQNQEQRNQAWQQDQPNLASIARNSNATGDHNPTQPQNNIRSTANRRPEEILDTVGRSNGTESGTGAYAGGIVNQAGTEQVPDN